GSESWPTLVITPGQHPCAALGREVPALAKVLGTGNGSAAPDDELRAAVTSHAADHAGPGARLILVVDQFEEVFTLAEEAERQRFVDVLRTISEDSPSGPAPAVVVFGMRSDFSHRCFDHPALLDALQHRDRLLHGMTIAQLTEAIERPAEAAGVSVESALVQLLLQDAGLLDEDGVATSRSAVDAGVLPLLSHALRITWEKRRGQRGPLTAQTYLDVGRLRGSVEQTADEAWHTLTERQQAAGLWLLVNLVHIGAEPSHDTRNPREWRELLAGAQHPVDAEKAMHVLVRERLVTVDTDTMQITHEALMRSWPRLASAITRHRDGLARRQRVEEAASAWEQSRTPHWWRRWGDGRNPDLLWRGEELESAVRWAGQATDLDRPSRAAQQFLRRGARKRTLTKSIVVAVIALLTLTTVAAVAEWADATGARNNAIFTQVVAEADRLRGTDMSLAAQLYLTAYRMRPTPKLYTNLLTTENLPLSTPLPGHTGIVRSVAVSADGRTLASAGDDRTVQLWNVGDPSRPVALGQLPTATAAVDAIALGPDGKTLVSGQADGLLLRWNVADPAHPVALGAPLAVGTGAIWGLSFSPDGRTLAGAGADGSVRLWNAADPAHPTPVGPPLPGAAALLYGTGLTFSPDGKVLASAGAGGTVLLWDVTDPSHPAALGGPLPVGARVSYAVAFSPDGHTLVGAGGDNVMALWNVTDPAHPAVLERPPTEHTSSILAVAFSPDGKTLASTGADDSVTLWDAADPAHLMPLGEPLLGHTRGVGAVAFSPDGRTLVTGSADSTVRLWSLPTTRLVGPTGDVASVAVSHHGRTLAVASGDNAVRLWDIARPDSPAPVGPVLRQDGVVDSVAFSPDDHVLVSGGVDRTARLWNVTDPAHPTALGPPLVLPGAVGATALSPDGRSLAIGCGDGTVRLFSVVDPTHPTPVGDPLPSTPGQLVGTVRFSPDSRTLASAGADHTVRLWDVTDPGHPRELGPPLRRHTDKVFQLAFSPDGRTLASASADHTVRLWNVSDPAHAVELGPPLTQHTNAVGGVAFNSDGTTLASGSDDETVLLWNVADPAHAGPVGQPLTGHTNFIYTVAFAPDGRTLVSGGRDHTVLIWQLDVDRAVHRICASTANELTPDAWNAYVSPALPYRPPCS
ncbi:MAG TPA: hypothetical protein VH008_10885, partial [Pseudonocardia sp.]|nr:hypothetical protein [Pseudonocardia sp.]